MQLFQMDTGWMMAREDVRFTVATVRAAGVHHKLLGPFQGVLASWSTIDGERQAAEDVLDDANALVTWLDGTLDEAVKRVVARLVSACDNDRKHPMFVAFFPEAPSAVRSPVSSLTRSDSCR